MDAISGCETIGNAFEIFCELLVVCIRPSCGNAECKGRKWSCQTTSDHESTQFVDLESE